jgi:quercetin dioxygenase-like cupin family protein
MTEPKRKNWNETPWTYVRDGVDRKAFSGTGATLAYHRLMPGHEPKPHHHPFEQLVYIVEGVVDFHVGDGVHRLGPGELIAIPPDVMHHAVVVGDVPAINLDIFTPVRHEYD